MSTRNKLILGGAVILVSFAFGRFSAPTKVVTQIKTVEVEKKVSDTEDHKKVVIVQQPDGTKTTTVTDDKSTKQKEDTQVAQESTKTVTRDSGRTSISALAGLQITGGVPVYGASLTRNVLGPITLGGFGFTNGLVGVSIGLSF